MVLHHDKDVRRLLDQAAIRELLGRYFHGLDRADYDEVRSCFTDDVVAQYDDRPGVRGIEAIMGSFKTFRRMKDGSMRITTHFMGNLNFLSLEGNIAETETNAIAFLVHNDETPAGQVAVRGLRYLDRLVHADGQWKIAVRRHTLDWSFQAPADFSLAFAQRLTSLPG